MLQLLLYWTSINQCGRTGLSPLLALLKWAETRANFTLPDGHTLWHYRAVIGYACEALLPAFAAFVMLWVLQMPDYADARARAKWEKLYLNKWYTASVSNAKCDLCDL